MDDFLSCKRFCSQSRPFPAEKDVGTVKVKGGYIEQWGDIEQSYAFHGNSLTNNITAGYM